MSSQVSNLFLAKLPCTRIQSVIEMMFVFCMCLFSLPLVPVPADVPSGTSPSKRGMCNATSAGIQLSLQVTKCQLKNRRLYKAPPPPLISAKARDFFRSQNKGNYFSVSHREHRNSPVPVCKKTFIHVMTIKTIYSRNNMHINVVLCLSYV